MATQHPVLTTVLGARAGTTSDTVEVESTANGLVTDTGKVLGTATTDEDDTVLLEVVALSGNVGNGRLASAELDTDDLADSRVGLTGLGGVDL